MTEDLSNSETEQQQPRAEHSVTAWVSLVVGCIGLACLGISMLAPHPMIGCIFVLAMPLGLLLGIAGWINIRSSKGRLKGKPIAAAGIVLALIHLSLIIYGVARFGDALKQFYCQHALHAIGRAMESYAEDNEGRYPDPNQWCDLIESSDELYAGVFKCPAADDGRCHYAMNPYCEPNSPGDTVLVFETHDGWNQYGGPELLCLDRHRGLANVVFNDRHVEFVRPQDINDLNWDQEIKH